MLICQQDPAISTKRVSDSFILPAHILWLPQKLNLLVQARATGCIMTVIGFGGLLSVWCHACDEPNLYRDHLLRSPQTVQTEWRGDAAVRNCVQKYRWRGTSRIRLQKNADMQRWAKHPKLGQSKLTLSTKQLCAERSMVMRSPKLLNRSFGLCSSLCCSFPARLLRPPCLLRSRRHPPRKPTPTSPATAVLNPAKLLYAGEGSTRSAQGFRLTRRR